MSFGIPVRNGLGVGLLASTSLATRNKVFTPASLFAAGEQGVWYDPSDFSTMYQDSTGVTPVTAVGQSVGFLGDKSQGFALGSNLFPNDGVISNTTGWVAANGGTLSAVGGGLRIVGNGVTAAPKATYTLTVTNGAWVRIRMSWSGNSGGTTIFLNGGSTEGTITSSTAASGTFDAVVKATNTTMLVVPVALSATSDITYSGFSVRELPGNHATQSTAASRPILGRVPVGGRRNLLERTEELNNAYWTAVSATVTPNAATAPDGTVTADRLTLSASGGRIQRAITTTSHTASIYVKYVSGSGLWSIDTAGVAGADTTIFNVQTGSIVSTGANNSGTVITALAGGWYRISTARGATAGSNIYFGLGAGSSSGDVVDLWGAQLETGSTATAYQRVVSAFDVTQAGVADCYYLQFDGTDDFMLTGTITPGTDKAQVFTGLRKLSDAAQGTAVAFGSVGADAGSFELGSPSGAAQPNYAAQLRGNSGLGGWTYTTYTAPITNVVTNLFNLADVTASGQNKVSSSFNGVVNTGTWSTGNAGVGNFGAYPLYLGRRATFLHFNGQLYSLIVRFGPNLTAGQITQTENYVAGETGIYNVEQLNRFATLDASGVSYNAYGAADANSNNYLVPKTVLAADGTPYSVL